MYHNPPSYLCNQQLLRVLEFHSPHASVLFVVTLTAACIVVKTVTALLSHHFIANSGPLHLKTASVFFSFAVVTAFGRPFLF